MIAAEASAENATTAVAAATALKLRIMNGEQITMLRMETSDDVLSEEKRRRLLKNSERVTEESYLME